MQSSSFQEYSNGGQPTQAPSHVTLLSLHVWSNSKSLVWKWRRLWFKANRKGGVGCWACSSSVEHSLGMCEILSSRLSTTESRNDATTPADLVPERQRQVDQGQPELETGKEEEGGEKGREREPSWSKNPSSRVGKMPSRKRAYWPGLVSECDMSLHRHCKPGGENQPRRIVLWLPYLSCSLDIHVRHTCENSNLTKMDDNGLGFKMITITNC